ncbi:rhodanese-like domain-containing protein [Rhodococcus sp. YH1]|uniref:rhodanese-like domain-containing protein n=1 Tax=Rhodococcus sp. YH1 TaxID=89066 RepID=UPI0013866C2E
MILEQYYIECLSHASYLIGDEGTGRAVVVDPRRDVTEYLDDAARHGLRIEGVINTHFHADFVSGHLELLEATGAWIGFGEFIGDVGRPDLVNLGDSSTEDLARAMYHTVHEKLLTLPDAVTVLPAHGAGSSCGKNLSTELTSTIGEQRVSNPSVQPMSEEAFVALVTEGQPAAPAYFSVDAGLNKSVHPLLDRGRTIPELSPARVRAELAAGTRVLDARGVDDFAAGHLRGSVNVGFDGRFAETGGMVAEVGEKIVLITYPGEEQDAAVRLARIGSDNAAGYLTVDHDGVFPAELADLLQTAPRTTVAQLDELLAADAVTLVDIRNPGEREFGVIPGAVPIPLAQLRTRLGQVPTGKPIVVHCAGGWRSSVAASLLRAQGFDNVSDLLGGYNAWAEAHVPA